MGLWLENRNGGNLVWRKQFIGGVLPGSDLLFEEDGEYVPFTVAIGRQLAKQSNGLPLEQREWVLRIGFNE